MQSRESRQFRFERLFDGRSWHHDAVLTVAADGRIAGLASDDNGDGRAERVTGWAAPGMANLHSHAFQRAMAGLAEYRSADADDFWSWRELMYRLAGRLSADEIEAIARHLYVEMLEAGYTSVCEFHYLHNRPDGSAYDDPAELSRRVVAAAADAGLGLTLLPVLYQRGGFDDRPLGDHQRRFALDTAAYLELRAALQSCASPGLRIGAAIHSLRAAGSAAIEAVLDSLDDDDPVHIHVAEQEAEVRDCLAAHGKRPVAWLLERFDPGPAWTLVHATHLDEAEVAGIAGGGATVALCPTTEANLGDGLFPLPAFLDAGGRFGIGSDSHVCVSPTEELRWLEYGQRLALRRRIVVRGEETRHAGRLLWSRALAPAPAATGRPVGRLAPGLYADLVVFESRPDGLDDDRLFDRLVFADRATRVDRVMVGGDWVVRDGRHPLRDAAAPEFHRIVAAYAS